MIFSKPPRFQRRRFRSFGSFDLRFAKNISELSNLAIVWPNEIVLGSSENVLSSLEKISAEIFVSGLADRISVADSQSTVLDLGLGAFTSYYCSWPMSYLENMVILGNLMASSFSSDEASCVLNLLAILEEHLGQLEKASSLLTYALKLVPTKNRYVSRVDLLNNLVIVKEKMYLLDEASRLLEQLQREEDLSESDLLRIYINGFYIYEKLGRINDAMIFAREAVKHASAMNNHNGLAKAHTLEGMLETELGNFESAILSFRVAATHDKEVNNKQGIIKSYCNEAAAYRSCFEARGNGSDLAASHSLYDRVLRKSISTPISRNTKLGILEQVVDLHFDMGNLDEAVEFIDESLALISGVRGYDHKIQRLNRERSILKGFLASRNGNHGLAKEHYQEAAERLSELGDELAVSYYEALASLEDAEEGAAKGESELAIDHFNRAISLLSSLSSRGWQNQYLKITCEFLIGFSRARIVWEDATIAEHKHEVDNAIRLYTDFENNMRVLTDRTPRYFSTSLVAAYGRFAGIRAMRLKLIQAINQGNTYKPKEQAATLESEFHSLSQVFLENGFLRLSQVAQLDRLLLAIDIAELDVDLGKWEAFIGEAEALAKQLGQHWLLKHLYSRQTLGITSPISTNVSFSLASSTRVQGDKQMWIAGEVVKIERNTEQEMEKDSSDLASCDFGVITALPLEFAAMQSMLENVKEVFIKGDPNDYVLGKIPALGGEGYHSIIITLLKKIGNNSAATAASHLLRSFPKVKDILMVGIAGGIPNPSKPDKHVRLGDIVVSNEDGLIEYDFLKLEDKEVKLRSRSPEPSALMLGRVKYLEAQRLAGHYPWEKHIKRGVLIEGAQRPDPSTDILFSRDDPPKAIPHPHDPIRREGFPRIHYGKIGTANILLKNSRIRDLLRDRLGILAVEMEGSGLADSTWTSGKRYILIRGICDYCDFKKNDIWQGYAAIGAAAYARALLESMPKDLQ